MFFDPLAQPDATALAATNKGMAADPFKLKGKFVWRFERETSSVAPAGHEPVIAARWASQPEPVAERYRVGMRDVDAVVLETNQQYERNGLKAPIASPDTSEPSTWIFTTIALLGLYG